MGIFSTALRKHENVTNFYDNATNFSENVSRKFEYRYNFLRKMVGKISILINARGERFAVPLSRYE